MEALQRTGTKLQQNARVNDRDPKWSGEVTGSRNKEAGSTEAQEQERERERMEVNIGREV